MGSERPGLWGDRSDRRQRWFRWRRRGRGVGIGVGARIAPTLALRDGLGERAVRFELLDVYLVVRVVVGTRACSLRTHLGDTAGHVHAVLSGAGIRTKQQFTVGWGENEKMRAHRHAGFAGLDRGLPVRAHR